MREAKGAAAVMEWLETNNEWQEFDRLAALDTIYELLTKFNPEGADKEVRLKVGKAELLIAEAYSRQMDVVEKVAAGL